MDRWDNVAIVAFIACDLMLENSHNFKLYSDYCYKNLKYEAKDIFKRLFK